MGYIWNIYEKSFTPYFATLAPKHQVHRHVMNPAKNKLSPFWSDRKTKETMKLIRKYCLKNYYVYYFLILVGK